jgi:hypothetical protein
VLSLEDVSTVIFTTDGVENLEELFADLRTG